jgi:hypothetical protein
METTSPNGSESSSVRAAGTSFLQNQISEIDRKVVDDLVKSKAVIEKIFEDMKKDELKV